MIKVSVIVPVYKVPEQYLRECLDSLTKQTLQESEFIIVSDGAPKLECSICEEYTKKDSRIKFFRREHAGVSATRNYGINHAKGEYLTFVDADDWVEPQHCELAYNVTCKYKSDLVLWEASTTIKSEHLPLFSKEQPILSKEEIRNICSNCIFTANEKFFSVSLVCCKLFRKNLLVQNGILFDSDLKINEDRLFNISAFFAANIISYFNKNTYHYRIHQKSSSHSYTPNAFYVLTKFLDKLNAYQKQLFAESIFKETIKSFFSCWNLCYTHPENTESLIQRYQSLASIVKDLNFQKNINFRSFRSIPIKVRIYLVFLKRKITFPIFFSLIKAKLTR